MTRPVHTIAALMALTFVSPAIRADSWAPATPTTDYPSADNRFIAHVVPAAKQRPAQLTVRAAGGDQPLWSVPLTNAHAPVEARISNDGRCVVTLDNWHGAGYGDDVLAFYTKTGQQKKYSLDALLASAGLKFDKLDFYHTVSSCWWRRDCVDLFLESGQRTSFCIWLDKASAWLAWDAATGEPVKLTEKELAQATDSARQHALEGLKRDDRLGAAIHILGWLRRPEDHKVLESLLAHPRFSRSYSTDGKRLLYVGAEAYVRNEADAALARWDGLEPGESQCAFLGSVHGSIELPEKPSRPEARLFVYLIPADVPQDGWAKSKSVHRLTANVGDHVRYPKLYPQVDETLDFRLQTVTPGRYWIKVIYDAAEPFNESDAELAIAGPGDFQSTARDEIEVIAGRITRAKSIPCTQRVGVLSPK